MGGLGVKVLFYAAWSGGELWRFIQNRRTEQYCQKGGTEEAWCTAMAAPGVFSGYDPWAVRNYGGCFRVLAFFFFSFSSGCAILLLGGVILRFEYTIGVWFRQYRKVHGIAKRAGIWDLVGGHVSASFMVYIKHVDRV